MLIVYNDKIQEKIYDSTQVSSRVQLVNIVNNLDIRKKTIVNSVITPIKSYFRPLGNILTDFLWIKV